MIQKISKGDGEASYSPKRGGMITSLVLHGKEILYLDRTTFENPSGPVRGGVPILFPNAGPLKSDDFPRLMQHGFARDNEWQTQKSESEFTETLRATDLTKSMYPYDFLLSISGEFSDAGVFSLKQKVTSLEKEKNIPISMGLHPYFRAPCDKKNEIKFLFPGGQEIESHFDMWSNGTFYSVPNPGVDLEVIIPELGTLVLNISKEYKHIWVWSLPGKDFVCIEPVIRDPGGLVHDPEMVLPGETFTGIVHFEFKA